MSFEDIERGIGEIGKGIIDFFIKPKPKRRTNTTSIPFSTKTTKLVDKSFSYLKLLFIAVEGNLTNSDLTTIKYKPHGANTFMQKQIYGISHARFDNVINELEIVPTYGDIRVGRCIVTYEGDYWSGGFVGVADAPIKVETIEEMRDLIHAPRNLISNAFFEQEYAGWETAGDMEIKKVGYPAFYMVHFNDSGVGALNQKFQIPIKIDSLTEFSCSLFGYAGKLNVNVIKLIYGYSDGSTSEEILQAAAEGWNKTVLSPTAGKQLWYLIISHLAAYKACGISNFIMVV